MSGGLTPRALAGACAVGAVAFGVAYGTAERDSAAEPVSVERLGAAATSLDVELPEGIRLGLGRSASLPVIASVPRREPPPPPPPPPPAPEPEVVEAPEPPPPPVVTTPPPPPAPDPVPPPPEPEPDPPPIDFDDSG